VQVTILLTDDDPVPCVCRFRQLLGVAEIVVVPTSTGRHFMEALRRAGLSVRLGEVNDDGSARAGESRRGPAGA
jgi:hypothetical protein